MNHIIGRNGVSRKMAREKLWFSVFSHRMKNRTHGNANAPFYGQKGDRRNHAGV
jgi:hypothetical protein